MDPWQEVVAFAQANSAVVMLTIVAVFIVTPIMVARAGGWVPREKVALVPKTDVEWTLIDKSEVSHDTRIFRFALQSPELRVGLPIGQHVQLGFVGEDGTTHARPYTPIGDGEGWVDFCIKVYRAGVNPRFPDGGVVSQHMDNLEIGDTITASGPKGRYEYKGRGELSLRKLPSQGGGFESRQCTRLGMIAGGSGVTPMIQIAEHILADPLDKTEVSLLFANQTVEDILLREHIEELAAKHDNFKVWYTVDKAPAGGKWPYSAGYISAEMVKEHLPPPGEGTQVLVCGPHPMVKFACQPAFDTLGYTKDQVIIW